MRTPTWGHNLKNENVSNYEKTWTSAMHLVPFWVGKGGLSDKWRLWNCLICRRLFDLPCLRQSAEWEYLGRNGYIYDDLQFQLGFKKSSTLCYASVVISNFVLGLLVSQLQFQMTPGWSLSSLALLYTSERRFKFYILERLKRIDKKNTKFVTIFKIIIIQL